MTQLRAGIEGARSYRLVRRLALRPIVELGLRRDGGNAERGAGLDVGGGLVVTDSASGLSVDVRVRTMVLHQAEGFSERGMAVTLGYNPTSTPYGWRAKLRGLGRQRHGQRKHALARRGDDRCRLQRRRWTPGRRDRLRVPDRPIRGNAARRVQIGEPRPDLPARVRTRRGRGPERAVRNGRGRGAHRERARTRREPWRHGANDRFLVEARGATSEGRWKRPERSSGAGDAASSAGGRSSSVRRPQRGRTNRDGRRAGRSRRTHY